MGFWFGLGVLEDKKDIAYNTGSWITSRANFSYIGVTVGK